MKRRGRAVGAVVPRHTICIGWLLGLALFFCAVRGFAQANDAPRVSAIDWGQAQTLIAIGAPPVAMSQIPAYNDWVSAPAVPEGVRDLGLRVQPNMELLSQLDIDVITITSMYAGLRERVAPIAPVETIDIYDGNGAVWDRTVESTRRLGALVGREAAAEALVNDTQARIEACTAQVPEHVKPLLVVQFIDARHVRVYTEDSLIGSVLERMGIANAYAALESGVRRFDASIAGLGGCPFAPGASGNIATEDLVLMLNQQGYNTGISLAGLAAAARLTRQWLPGVGLAKSTQWIERQIEKGAL